MSLVLGGASCPADSLTLNLPTMLIPDISFPLAPAWSPGVDGNESSRTPLAMPYTSPERNGQPNGHSSAVISSFVCTIMVFLDTLRSYSCGALSSCN